MHTFHLPCGRKCLQRPGECSRYYLSFLRQGCLFWVRGVIFETGVSFLSQRCHFWVKGVIFSDRGKKFSVTGVIFESWVSFLILCVSFETGVSFLRQRFHFNHRLAYCSIKGKAIFFQHGYDNYMQHAWPLDELNPLACCGRGEYLKYFSSQHCQCSGPDTENPDNININDVLGNFSHTLIDSLDTLAGNLYRRQMQTLLCDLLNFSHGQCFGISESSQACCGHCSLWQEQHCPGLSVNTHCRI